ncbi:hypothetical protein NQ314_018736 [Rhamnusium bicolor]|uniref:C2H2-type domain-containing protein n=1 Tax=Rhamnusium bicolor TaxID=1586634 RepID=A0AAV8WQ44_9CUCU|nr:hypothetical protein NQ314_018736 [Rhamnusium bicolor]
MYKSTLENHKRVVHTKENVYICDLCDKIFTNPLCAKIHMENIHLKEYKFFCDKCGRGYYQRTQLITHVESVHQGIRHTCDICRKIFTTKANLKKHSFFHAPDYKKVECPICFKVFAPRSYKLHEKKHSNNAEVNAHICEICGKFVSSSWSLKDHMRTHTGEKPYACDVCSKCFSKSQILTTHKRTHTKERPFICKICNKAFTQKPALNVHMRYHSGEKPYSCNVCSKCFVTKTLLNNHNCPGPRSIS